MPHIAQHLSVTRYGQDGRYSSLIALLRDTRGVTHRDEHGHYADEEEAEHSQSWIGAIGYLLILDQVGTCFSKAREWETSGIAIVRALRYWASEDVSAGEAQALYALRCSLVHAYSLWNPGYSVENPGEVIERQRHRFVLVADVTSPIVRLPPQSQRGKAGRSIADTGETLVNLRAVADLVESIVTERLPAALAQAVLAWDPEMSLERLTDYGFAIRSG
jgi:hypothetical protein